MAADRRLHGAHVRRQDLRSRTAAPTIQCIYSSVSKANLQKTGVLLNSAGDFREFSPKKFKNGATGDFQQLEKPAIGGPFCYLRRKFSETRTAWLGREDSNLDMANCKWTLSLVRRNRSTSLR